MVFWLIGVDAPIIKKEFEIEFKMLKNCTKTLWCTFKHSIVCAQSFIKKNIFCGICKKQKKMSREKAISKHLKLYFLHMPQKKTFYVKLYVQPQNIYMYSLIVCFWNFWTFQKYCYTMGASTPMRQNGYLVLSSAYKSTAGRMLSCT
jgi:hypothetical protein